MLLYKAAKNNPSVETVLDFFGVHTYVHADEGAVLAL